MSLNVASAVVLFAWGAPLAALGGYIWRRATQMAADRVATDEEESGGSWRWYWPWQRTQKAVRSDAVIWGLAGIVLLAAALLEVLRVGPPLF
ncbi:hypothetical protein GCM10009869_14340 [Amnibacterium kyonggiense]